MEFDRQLLESFQEGDLPILRFFFFDRPTLTLGRLEARRLKLEELSFPYEIRPTGGRAVLHGSEDLCYAVVASKQDPLAGGDLIDSYCKIGHLLSKGIQALGREVRMVEEKHTSLGDVHCFSAPSKAELTLNGKKVAGGAQARRGGVFLQQGVLLLSVSEEWEKAFPGASLEGMTGLNDPQGSTPITRDRLEMGLIDSFEKAGARFERP
jgi:lipoate-protein ligase A